MIWTRIWIHILFSTIDEKPLIDSPEERRKLYDHLKQYSIKNRIWIDTINGHKEHIHCLLSLGKDQTITELVTLIKQESLNWLNNNNIKDVIWQNDYWAVSIGECDLSVIRDQINNQEIFHKKIS